MVIDLIQKGGATESGRHRGEINDQELFQILWNCDKSKKPQHPELSPERTSIASSLSVSLDVKG